MSAGGRDETRDLATPLFSAPAQPAGSHQQLGLGFRAVGFLGFLGFWGVGFLEGLGFVGFGV